MISSTFEKKRMVHTISLFLLVLLMLSVLYSTKTSITGLTVLEPIIVNQTSSIDLGINLTNLALSGEANGTGTARVFLGDKLVAQTTLDEINNTVKFDNICIETCNFVNQSSQLSIEINGTLQLIISGFNYTLQNTAVQDNTTEINITELRSEIRNQTTANNIKIYTDKSRYLKGETINIFGSTVIDGKEADTNATLNIEFNDNTMFSAILEITNGSYVYSLSSEFESEGVYYATMFVGDLSGQTLFSLSNDTSAANKTNITITELRTTQGKAEVGKPVKWKKLISVEKEKDVKVENKTLEIELPEFAENITLRDLTNVQQEKITIMPPKAMQFGTASDVPHSKKINWVEKEIPDNFTIGYALEYETPAPVKEEKENYAGQPGQKLIVVRNTALVHYSNVTVSTNISQYKNVTIIPNKSVFSSTDTPEFQIRAGAGLRLFWINGTEALFNATTDVTNDEKHNATFTGDILSWTVPQLSEQTYIVEPIPANISNITNAFVEDSQGNFLVQAEVTNNSFGDIVIKVPIIRNVISGQYTIVIVTADNQTYRQQFYWWLTENLVCRNFEELVLWSSGYSDKEAGSTNYYTWTPSSKCAEFRNNTCFIGNAETESRFLYFGENSIGEGYLQIAKLDAAHCGNPIQGIYSAYIARENLYGESYKLNQFCGNTTNQVCGAKVPDDSGTVAQCYGIKARASQYMIVDIFKIKYFVCGEKNE